MSSVYVCVAPGLEEVECLAVVDMLRRGGVRVELASMGEELFVTGSHNITIKADSMWSEEACRKADAIFLPGGMPGTKHLADHEGLGRVIREFDREGKVLAAICAAPSVLGKYGCLDGRRATCYPGFEEYLEGAAIGTDKVVIDGKIVTSKGPGTAIDFAFELLNLISGKETVDKVKTGMLLK